MSTIKNNPAALFSALAQLTSASAGGSPGAKGGKISPENAVQLLQNLTQMAGTLQKLQDSLGLGKADGFGAPPAAKPQGGASSPIEQLTNLLKTLLDALDPNKANAGAPGAEGGAPGAGGGAPGAGGGAPGAGAPGAAGGPGGAAAAGGPGGAAAAGGPGGLGAPGALPFADAASSLNNLKQEQAALMGKIAEGVKSGKINPQELGPLLQGVKMLAQATKAASADGQITAGEATALSQMSMNNIQATKSAFENGLKSDFAALNPAAQTQAQQLGDISQGLMDGSISNAELADLANDQSAISDAMGKVSTVEDATKLMTAQQLVGMEAQLARLSKVNG